MNVPAPDIVATKTKLFDCQLQGPLPEGACNTRPVVLISILGGQLTEILAGRTTNETIVQEHHRIPP
jgi:hypothetical protein